MVAPKWIWLQCHLKHGYPTRYQHKNIKPILNTWNYYVKLIQIILKSVMERLTLFPFLWFCPHDSKLWIPVFYIKSYLLRGQSPKKSLKSNRPTIFHLDIVCNKINLLKWRNSNSIITNWLEVKFYYKFQSGITVGDSTKPYICHYKPHLGLTHINTHLHACTDGKWYTNILSFQGNDQKQLAHTLK